MAKLSAVNKNKSRIKLSDRLYKKRAALKKIVMDKKITLEERFKAQQKLSKLPRNSAKTRVMNRCEIRGLDITIVIKSNSKEHSLELLKKFNFPFREERSN